MVKIFIFHTPIGDSFFYTYGSEAEAYADKESKTYTGTNAKRRLKEI